MAELSETPTGDAAEQWLKTPERNKSPEERYNAIVDRIKAWTAEHNLHSDETNRYHSEDSRWIFSIGQATPGFISVTGLEQDITFRERKGLGKLLPIGGGPQFNQLAMHEWWIVTGGELGRQYILYKKFPEDPNRKPSEVTEGGYYSVDGSSPNKRMIVKSRDYKEVDALAVTEKFLTVLESSRPHIHAGGMKNYPSLKAS